MPLFPIFITNFIIFWNLTFQALIVVPKRKINQEASSFCLAFLPLHSNLFVSQKRLINHCKAHNAIEIDGAYVPGFVGCGMGGAGCKDAGCRMCCVNSDWILCSKDSVTRKACGISHPITIVADHTQQSYVPFE